MIISQLFIAFIVFSIIGWVYECTYVTIRTKKWDNRGFLYGPLCPIYGSGVVLALVVFRMLPVFSAGNTPVWEIFLICAIGSAILEYVTSWTLEKFFHAVWWDYSYVPLNIHGRVCLPATTGFGVAGVLIVKVLFPFLADVIARTHINEHPLLNEVVALGMMMWLGMDLALTISSLTKLVTRLEAFEESFDEKMENRVQLIAENMTKRERYHLRSIHSFRTEGAQAAAAKLKTRLSGLGKKLRTPMERAARKNQNEK